VATVVQRLEPPHAQAYRALMLDAYAAHPDAFTSSAQERAALPMAWWQERLSPAAGAESVVFGAFVDGTLAGAAGLTFEPRAKARHKATLFGMYVAPGRRAGGVGAALVQGVLDHARGLGLRQVLLTVTRGNDAAQALYERCGFTVFGIEPRAVNIDGAFMDKVHMWCDLDPSAFAS